MSKEINRFHSTSIYYICINDLYAIQAYNLNKLI